MNGAPVLDAGRRRALEAAWNEFALPYAEMAHRDLVRGAFFADAIAAIVLRNGPARGELLREVRDYVSGIRSAAGGA